MLVVAGLMARGAVVTDRPLALLPAGAVALLGLLVLGRLAARRERTARAAAEQGGPGSDRDGVRAVTAVVVLTAGAALVTALAALVTGG